MRRFNVGALALAALLAADWACAKDLVLHAGRLIDGLADTPRSHVSLVIRDGKIASIEEGFISPAGAEVIDLSRATVLPGLIDCHIHISALLPSRTNATEYELTHSDLDRAFDGALFARRLLQQGFTSARDVAYGTDLGEGDHAMEYRMLIENGMKPMDALFAATRDAAALLGTADSVGSLRAGYLADVIAVSEDPLTTPDALEHVTFVMKGGTVYKQNGLATAVAD